MNDSRPEPSDARLEALWQGEAEFVTAVLLAHLPRGDDELEDLRQEVALRLHRQLEQRGPPDRVRAWLHTVAVHVARSAQRRTETRPHATSTVDPAGLAAIPGDDHALPDVLAKVRRLPHAYREPLVLRAVRGMSQRAIAELLGLPETTIETRLARARRLLRDLVAEDDPRESAARVRLAPDPAPRTTTAPGRRP